MIKYRIIALFIGVFLVLESLFMLISTIIAIIFSGNDIIALSSSTLITFICGFFLWFFNRKTDKKIQKRESFIIISLTWIILSLFGALPYIIYWNFSNIADGIFESVSGLTTTGSTILTNIEAMPKGILFWRSISQFIGGLGIIIISLAFLSFVKSGETNLFNAESAWLSSNKLHPRFSSSAKRILLLYLGFTILEIILLSFGGMSFYESVCHSFTTMSSGGFSTRQSSIAAFHSRYTEYVIIIFMIISGINFKIIFLLITFQFRKVFRNTEFKFYLGFLLGASLLVGIILLIYSNSPIEYTLRKAFFNVISIITTTGYSSSDYMLWNPSGIWIILLFLMFIGGSSCSTSGGIKMIRIHIILKNILNEFKRIIHPHAVLPVRYNNTIIKSQDNSYILIFFISYILIIIFGTIVMNVSKVDFDPITAFGATISSLGNVGISIGNIGHTALYQDINNFQKIFLSFLMIIGRLEIFTVLVIFTYSFWKR
ncbi:MAG: TrkH family potassium uptake protein [Bacteroidales bacterium]|jgi:trk system potassium uptake protein TrkH|nr:TrkH family potassium uptake protein [Bacteroidales bacterium]